MTGHMRCGAAPEAWEVRVGPARPPTTSLRSDTTQCCDAASEVELRKWGGSGAWRTTPLPPRSALCSPAHRLAIRTSPPSLFQDAERPDKCSECALPALYIQQSDSRHVRTHPFPPLPLCMLLLLSYTRSLVAAKGHLFGAGRDTVSPK